MVIVLRVPGGVGSPRELAERPRYSDCTSTFPEGELEAYRRETGA